MKADKINEKEYFKDRYVYFLSREKKARIILNELNQFANLGPNKKIKVLAVGGEYGFIEYNLSKWTRWNIITSDIEENLIKKYPKFKKYVTTKVLDATKLPYKDNSFDLVICNHVIEHILNYTTAINEIYRILKKSGYIYLATPNSHRKFVNPKIILTNKKRISDSKRIALHMGFSREELNYLLSMFSNIQNVTVNHQIKNLRQFGHVAKILPKSLFLEYSQTNVFICQK